MGKSISSSFQSSDDDGTQEEASVLKTKAKQLKAYQMLVAILNLGDENTAIKKIAQMYQAQTEASEIEGIGKAGGKELKELQAKFESTEKDREAPVFEIVIPANKVFRDGTIDLMPNASPKLVKLGKWIENVKDKITVHVRSWVSSKKGNSFVKDLSLSSSRAIVVSGLFGTTGIYNDRITAEGKVFEEFKPNSKQKELNRREMPEEELIHIIIYRLAQE